MSALRYRVGFGSPHIGSSITERNPGYVPVVDTRTNFVCGIVVAIVDSEGLARRIAALLNAAEVET